MMLLRLGDHISISTKGETVSEIFLEYRSYTLGVLQASQGLVYLGTILLKVERIGDIGNYHFNLFHQRSTAHCGR